MQRGVVQVTVRTQRFVACLGLLMAAAATPLLAQSDGQTERPLGLWQTEYDANGIVFHVRTRGCGRALCGRVERVKNRRGYDAPSNAVGQKVIWSMRPQPDGSFFGEVRDTRGQPYTQSRLELAGNGLRVRLCDADGCRGAFWKRLR